MNYKVVSSSLDTFFNSVFPVRLDSGYSGQEFSPVTRRVHRALLDFEYVDPGVGAFEAAGSQSDLKHPVASDGDSLEMSDMVPESVSNRAQDVVMTIVGLIGDYVGDSSEELDFLTIRSRLNDAMASLDALDVDEQLFHEEVLGRVETLVDYIDSTLKADGELSMAEMDAILFSDEVLTTVVNTLIMVIASVIAVALLFPIDRIKTHVQNRGMGDFGDIVKETCELGIGAWSGVPFQMMLTAVTRGCMFGLFGFYSGIGLPTPVAGFAAGMSSAPAWAAFDSSKIYCQMNNNPKPSFSDQLSATRHLYHLGGVPAVFGGTLVSGVRTGHFDLWYFSLKETLAQHTLLPMQVIQPLLGGGVGGLNFGLDSLKTRVQSLKTPLPPLVSDDRTWATLPKRIYSGSRRFAQYELSNLRLGLRDLQKSSKEMAASRQVRWSGLSRLGRATWYARRGWSGAGIKVAMYAAGWAIVGLTSEPLKEQYRVWSSVFGGSSDRRAYRMRLKGVLATNR